MTRPHSWWHQSYRIIRSNLVHWILLQVVFLQRIRNLIRRLDVRGKSGQYLVILKNWRRHLSRKWSWHLVSFSSSLIFLFQGRTRASHRGDLDLGLILALRFWEFVIGCLIGDLAHHAYTKFFNQRARRRA